jgi:ion channel
MAGTHEKPRTHPAGVTPPPARSSRHVDPRRLSATPSSCYFSLITVTIVCYGDVLPVTAVARIWAALEGWSARSTSPSRSAASSASSASAGLEPATIITAVNNRKSLSWGRKGAYS